MVVRTKKYKMPQKIYIKTALLHTLRQQWWVLLIYFGLFSGYLIVPSIWWFIGPTIALVLYILFWLIQFTGVTQLEQGKFMFEKLSYEISSQQILIKLSSKQGMPVKWENIKRAIRGKDFFVLFMSKAQLIYLPEKIFNSNHEIKFMETILKRKGYIKEG